MPSNLRYGLRTLIRRRGFATVVILTLALGIGATVGIFSVANAVLLRELPYPNADRLVALHTLAPDGTPTGRVAPRDMPTLYANEPALAAAALAFYTEGRIQGADGTAYNMGRYGVTDQFFDVFDMPMALGRGFERGEAQGPVVISYSTWRDVFASDPAILGKAIPLENGTRPVVGVAPEGFDFPGNAGYWTLMQLGPGYANLRGYLAFLRLSPNATRAQLDARLTALGPELGADANSNRPVRFATEPLLDYVVGDLGPTVLLLLGATAILLLIACINVANLLLSRGMARGRELALRAALGARRDRIFGHLLSESFVLAAIGGALGLVVGVIGIRVLLRLGPADLPRLESVPIDGNVLAFAVGAAVITGLLAGLTPAWRLASVDLRTLVNEGGRGASAGARQQRVFAGLVVAEIALAVVLVIGAGLLVRSYYNLVSTDPGFRTERMLSMFVNVPGEAITTFFVSDTGNLRAPDGTRYDATYRPIADFFRELEARVGALSGVEAVSVSTTVPLSSEQWDNAAAFAIVGDAPVDPTVAQTQALHRGVSPSFFRAMGIPVLAGRSLEPADGRDAPGAVVVNETFARRFFSDGSPVGRRLTFPENLWQPTGVGFQYGERITSEFEIVGVVGDVRYAALAEPPEPAIYLSNEQFTSRRTNLLVRSSTSNPETLIPAIRQVIAELEPMPVEFELYSQIMRVSLARERLGMSLFAAFGLVALALAAVGIYGLMSYSVALRSGEIAVRSALGASTGQVLALVLRRGLVLGAAGVAIGVIAAAALRRVVASQLYDVSSLDWAVFLGVPATLLAVALLASYLPARRAARVDPAVTLHSE
jgi:putative ABC transport system permease protein